MRLRVKPMRVTLSAVRTAYPITTLVPIDMLISFSGCCARRFHGAGEKGGDIEDQGDAAVAQERGAGDAADAVDQARQRLEDGLALAVEPLHGQPGAAA